jgi:hypothetical protein
MGASVVGFAPPIPAMTCDVGDSGDRRALRAPPPLRVHPTSSQVIPDWRILHGCLAFVVKPEASG